MANYVGDHTPVIGKEIGKDNGNWRPNPAVSLISVKANILEQLANYVWLKASDNTVGFSKATATAEMEGNTCEFLIKSLLITLKWLMKERWFYQQNSSLFFVFFTPVEFQ